jgi:hypothetical protein
VNHLAEGLGFFAVPPTPGVYTVHKLIYDVNVLEPLNSSFTLWDDDQGLGGYDVLESDSATNQIVLASYDTLSKEIQGTFNVTYIVHGDHLPNLPDIVRIKDGKFHGKLIKK